MKNGETPINHLIRPTCHYDIIDFVFVAEHRDRPLGNKHKISDVIMTSRSYHVTSRSSPLGDDNEEIIRWLRLWMDTVACWCYSIFLWIRPNFWGAKFSKMGASTFLRGHAFQPPRWSHSCSATYTNAVKQVVHGQNNDEIWCQFHHLTESMITENACHIEPVYKVINAFLKMHNECPIHY